MPGSVVQVNSAAQNTAATPGTATLLAGATAGNTIVVVYGGDDYVTSGNKPAGFTEPTGARQETFLGHYVWFKVAAGGETSFNFTPNAAAHFGWIVAEMSGVGALDISNGTLLASSGTTMTTPTVTPTAGPRFAVASIGGSHGTVAFNPGMGSWTNSFVEAADIATLPSGFDRDNVGLATLSFTANGSSGTSTGITWDGAVSAEARTGIILVFQEASASAGPDPVFAHWQQRPPGRLSPAGFWTPTPTDPSTSTVSIVNRTASDTAAATDVAAGSVILARSLTDTAAATDTAARSLNLPRSTSETAVATDTAAGTVFSGQSRTASDTAAATDVATRTLIQSRTAPSTAAATDAATRTSARTRTAADAAAATDVASRSLTLSRPVADTAAATDAATRSSARSRSLSDTAIATDTATGTLGGGQSRTAADTAIATDTATRAAQAFSRTAPSTAPATDVAGRAVARTRTTSDTAVATDAVTKSLVRSRTATDAAIATDVATRAAQTFARTAADTALATDVAVSAATGGVTYRPFSGTTGRPGTGTTARPNTGITVRP